MNKIINDLLYYLGKGLMIFTLFLIIFVGLTYCHPALAELSPAAQRAYDEEQARIEWIKEHGEWQPNLTPETEKYLQKMTALLQEARNGKTQ